MAIFRTLAAIFLWPFRVLTRLFFGRAVSKATGSAVARSGSGGAARPSAQEVPHPTSSFPFKTIERPRLAEISATEITLDVAKGYMTHARRFYDHEFNLFPADTLFYEEIEAEELEYALGADDETSYDRNFVHWIDLFRQTLNDNVRRLFVVYTPLLFLLFFGLAVGVMGQVDGGVPVPGVEGVTLQAGWLMPPILLGVALWVLTIVYQWPFKTILQRNTLGLDNYITSRFSRINQNFQVAKRHALNVERNKRMPEADELRHEAGVWTVAYNWLAIRLFLCERMVRNKMYQINRNATLYRVTGIVVCLTLIVGFGFLPLSGVLGLSVVDKIVAISSAVVFVFLAYALVMGQASTAAYRAFSSNEWFRFGGTDLDKTISDHVAEDKLQIVTFRDRNRME